MSIATAESSRPLVLRSARWMAAALKRREIGAVELLDEHFRQLDRHNGLVNAVVATDRDAARAVARKADEAMARGDAVGPLHGLPMTIKDAFEVVGMPATCGLPELARHLPGRDADSVAALRHAGAVLYGKTNVPAGVSDHQSYNAIYGVTRNPWNPDRTPGGSSGGSAAAVAAGFAALELGSDIGGSIRVPCHFCGVFGHKPSWRVVSGRGHIPPMPGEYEVTPVGVFGPIARSAYDLELALDVLAQPDRFDRRAWSIRLPPSRQQDLRSFRVGLWLDAHPLDDGYRAAIDGFVDDLRRLGVTIDRAARPVIRPADSFDIYLDTLMGALIGAVPEAAYRVQVAAGRQAAAADPDGYPARIGRAMAQSARHWAATQKRRQDLITAWREFFGACDLLLCPVFPCVAFPHDTSGDGHMAQYDRRLTVSGQPIAYLDGLTWPGLATVADLPATAIPTGHLVDGLPAGIQAIGPYLEDRTPLRFAQLVEDALGGFRVAPMVATA